MTLRKLVLKRLNIRSGASRALLPSLDPLVGAENDRSGSESERPIICQTSRLGPDAEVMPGRVVLYCGRLIMMVLQLRTQ